MDKLTLNKAKDELVSAALLALGLTGGSVLMKMAGSKLPSPWITPAVAFGSGLAIRMLVDNDNAKDLAAGVMAAGAADGLKKGLAMLSTKVPALAAFTDPITTNIPQLSGPAIMSLAPGLRGGFADAQVVESTLASSLR